MATFSSISQARLLTCIEPLQRIFNKVIESFNCTVQMGARTLEEEQAAIDSGHSRLKNPRDSKHVITPDRPLAEAVDVTPYPLDWQDTERFAYFAGQVIATARAMGIEVRWGGDWNEDTEVKDEHFRDLDHFEWVKGG